VAAATGARLLGETFSARLERGGGLPELERVAYLGEFATAQLQGLRTLVLVEARAPVSFFAYPERPSLLAPEGCRVVSLSQPGQDSVAALLELCERLHAGALGLPPPVVTRGARPTGAIDVTTFAAAVAEVLPEGAIVSDEANTSGTMLLGATASAPRHDWLSLTGGAIGQGLPVATGAAVACPDRPVLCLEADGSAMYTLQALWTQARESLNVTTVLLNNGSYAILEFELNRLASAAGGGGARQLLSLAGPALDWVALARGLGVAASRATTAEELTGQLSRAMSEPGPALIEVVLQGA
jgi:acetolactate synthase-1/2/3 large subunit